MGASAGAMNMGAKIVPDEGIDAHEIEASEMADGLSLDNFVLESHAKLSDRETIANSKLFQYMLRPLSNAFDVYIACEESTMRVRNGRMDVMGDVYLLSGSEIHNLEDTL